MEIYGLNKTTLLDYPGRVACTLFTGGCNFRCPFCQNSELVLCPDTQPVHPEQELFAFLEKRAGILSGVCITGGEPTLQPDLPVFIQKIKALGYAVKLDTNGARPDVLRHLLEKGLVDYIAMDVKNAPGRYPETAGIPGLDIRSIQESVSLIKDIGLDYEFRTTIVKELHSEDDICVIGEWLAGCRAYYLQSYQDSETVLLPGFHAHDESTLQHFVKVLQQWIPNTQLRGI